MVSILVPVYGVERYIGACAESLLAQDYSDIEYIFVDDCTPDASLEVLADVVARYPERRHQVRILHHDHNRGVGAARATAVSAATGTYLMHVDSDDRLAPGAVSALVQRMEETGADIVDGAYALLSDDSLSQPLLPCEASDERYLRLMLCQNIVKNNLWARLYRRTLYQDHAINFVEGIDYSEDYSLLVRLLCHARRATMPTVVYHYRVDNQSSYTHTVSERAMRSYLRSCNLAAQYIHDLGEHGLRYRSAADIGIVNAWRELSTHAMDHRLADNAVGYRPHLLTARLCIALLRRKWPVALVNLLYLPMRKLYAWRA